nr:unnamed protein product [Callosobruchus analis]
MDVEEIALVYYLRRGHLKNKRKKRNYGYIPSYQIETKMVSSPNYMEVKQNMTQNFSTT